MADSETPTDLNGNEIQSKLKINIVREQSVLLIPDLPNIHLLMRIPFLKIFAVSCVSPNSWIEMEPNWAWIKLKTRQQSHKIYSGQSTRNPYCFSTGKDWLNKPTSSLSCHWFWSFPPWEIWKNTVISFILDCVEPPPLCISNPQLKSAVMLFFIFNNINMSDLMVTLFLSLFRVFRGLFSFTLSWMSLNSLLFDTNSICTYSHFLS